MRLRRRIREFVEFVGMAIALVALWLFAVGLVIGIPLALLYAAVRVVRLAWMP